MKPLSKKFAKIAVLCAIALCFALPTLAAPADKLTPVEREVKTAADEFQKKMQALRKSTESGDDAALQEARKKYQVIQKEFTARVIALSKKDPKDPGTVDALILILFAGRNTPEAKDAMATIKRDYLASPNIAPMCQYFEQDKDGEKILKEIAEKNPDPNAKAMALYSLGDLAKESDEARAVKYFKEVVTKYPDAKIDSVALFGRSMKVAEDAKNELFSIEHLGIGKPAPEITGEDVDGKKFSLSEYRGKVVVLDFWGDW